mmetsp:Transcript_12239/g.36774  ORF Transcript_12239/g.36774 Transcript_12239/m.36774 type:complete len:562 (+) Transcript_12239:318-2003(+)
MSSPPWSESISTDPSSAGSCRCAGLGDVMALPFGSSAALKSAGDGSWPPYMGLMPLPYSCRQATDMAPATGHPHRTKCTASPAQRSNTRTEGRRPPPAAQPTRSCAAAIASDRVGRGTPRAHSSCCRSDCFGSSCEHCRCSSEHAVVFGVGSPPPCAKCVVLAKASTESSSRRAAVVSVDAASIAAVIGGRKISTPRLRIARDTSPCLGSRARMRRKSGCGFTRRGPPSPEPPASFSSSTPLGSSTLFSRSRTAAAARLAPRSNSHPPFSTATVRAPSTHSNLPAPAVGASEASSSAAAASDWNPPSLCRSCRAPGRAAAKGDTNRSNCRVVSRRASRGRLVPPELDTPVSSAWCARWRDHVASSAVASWARWASVGTAVSDSADSPCTLPLVPPWSTSATPVFTAVETASTSPCTARSGSCCSKPPRRSLVSLPPDSDTSTSSRPARAAAARATEVFPEAGPPTIRAGQPLAKHSTITSSTASWPGARVRAPASPPIPPERSRSGALGTQARPIRTHPGVRATDGRGCGGSGVPQARSNASATAARSLWVRMRCTASRCT